MAENCFICELFHYMSTNAKYLRLENLYKMIIDHLHRMAQAIYKFFFEIGLSVNDISKTTTRCQTRVCKNTKINFEALAYGRKLVFVSKYTFLGMEYLNLDFNLRLILLQNCVLIVF